MRWSVVVAAVSLSIIGLAAADDVRASIKRSTNIPSQGLGSALQRLAKDRNFQVVYVSEEVNGLRTQGAVGEFTPEEALKTLLHGTGLTYRYLDEKTVTIFPAIAPSSQDNSGGASTQVPAKATTEQLAAADPGEGKDRRSLWDRFRVAQVDQGTSAGSTPVERQNAQPSKQQPVQLEEVLVTAQKREERLQDVPVPVTALSPDTLVDSNQLRLQDYYTSVPGLSVTPSVQSVQVLSIRGITTGGFTNPTVGVTVDDVPYGSSTGLGGGLTVPDIDPGDLARVEVLRGPQGTLYGASSMGGLLKFVTVDPSTDGVSGHVQAGTSSVHNGAELGYNFRGSINLPLNDTTALRASAFTREDPGYIDNPTLHKDGINKDRVSGGRLSGLWRPSDAFSLKLSALYQETKGDGLNDADVPTAVFPQTAGLHDLQQIYLPGVGPYDRKIHAYSAVLSAKLGSVDLTAVSGYNINSFNDSFDYTYAYGPLLGGAGVPVFDDISSRKFTQEIRLSVPIGKKADWLLGAFYTHENSRFGQSVFAANPVTGTPVLLVLSSSIPTTFVEYAAFTDVTFHVTDRFDVQAGGRESRIEQTFAQTQSGVIAAPPIAQTAANSNAFTYLVTPQFRLSPDLMVYARLASGYRAGGINATPGFGTPPQYNPDKTRNYDLGLKGDFLNRQIAVDASLYYIQWKDIQLALINPTTAQGYNTNGGEAESHGVELSIESRPTTALTIGAWAVWNDAKLTQTFPASGPNSAFGVDGDRLPYSSRFSGNLSLEQEFPLTANLRGVIGGVVKYVGQREGVFGTAASPQRQAFPAYTALDLRTGVSYESWRANLFVTNVADRRGVTTGGLGAVPPFAFTYIQPRTVGVSVSRSF